MIAMLVVFTGGTGGAKLIEGLSHEADLAELTIVCNTADDFVLHGLNISPDLDTIMYTLAGMSDAARGWGIRDDGFSVLTQLEKLGGESWFKLGDKDIATHLMRTRLLREGLPLSECTDRIRRQLGVKARLLPMTDDRVETRLETAEGEISFQEYFVKRRWQPAVRRVLYAGVESSRPAPGVVEAIDRAAGIVFCPSNPITSIGPILAVPGISEALARATANVIGVSPIIGSSAISGPAHKLMTAQGLEPSAVGVSRFYSEFLDSFVIDSADAPLRRTIEALGIGIVETPILMQSLDDKRRLAREVMALVEK
jgi:LPPG:FO 2-phospho-L-lactate transferase